jgi:hypothetical protein
VVSLLCHKEFFVGKRRYKSVKVRAGQFEMNVEGEGEEVNYEEV